MTTAHDKMSKKLILIGITEKTAKQLAKKK